MVLQGIRTSIAKKPYIFVIFRGVSVPPVPPSGSAHGITVCHHSTRLSKPSRGPPFGITRLVIATSLDPGPTKHRPGSKNQQMTKKKRINNYTVCKQSRSTEGDYETESRESGWGIINSE